MAASGTTTWAIALLLTLCCVSLSPAAGQGDADPAYRTCVEQCQASGYVGETFIGHCQVPTNDTSDSFRYNQEPLYMQWKQLNCITDCSYYCMTKREQERQSLGLAPTKYHGKWPFKRISVFQEPLSAIFSAINLLVHFTGWLSFFSLVNYKLPLRRQSKRAYYEYASLWHIYAIFLMNAWFWSSIFHVRDLDLTNRLEFSSSVALLGYSLIFAFLRTFSVKVEATRVMVGAPIAAFVATHILYLNFYQFEQGWFMQVFIALAVVQLLTWALWAILSHHPSQLKLWAAVIFVAAAVVLKTCDFPPYEGYADARTLSHAAMIPVAFLIWSFAKDDAKFRTSILTKKAR